MGNTKRLLLLASATATLVTANSSCSAATTVPRGASNVKVNVNVNTPLLLTTRGGKTNPSKKKKKKNKSGKAKKVIEHAMKEKDSAQALGDAIRDRADVLRQEDPLLQSIDWSIHSLSHGLGASDSRMQGGGVQAATTSILANYFLKSHGGAHGLQVACSLMATISGLCAIFLQKKHQQPFAFTCLQRCLLFAMVKHVSGLLAAAAIAAKAIPKIGLSQARGWMEQLVLDPVSQYVCYTALILLWLPSKTRLIYAWWVNYPWVAPLLVGPIMLREIISNMLVVSDILVLSSMNGEPSGMIQTVLNISQSTINAFMSLLVSPQKWRGADPAKRQAILAKLVSKVSLFMEVAVGLVLCLDFGYAFFQMAFTGGPKRPPLKETVMRLLCVRLYVHFLWVRRNRISKLGLQVRGGATQLPFWILDVVLEPSASMGLPVSSKKENTDDPSRVTWKDYVFMALGIDRQ